MEHLLLSLIKDDLVHARLLNGLMELGFDTTDYYLNLNEAVFAIAGLNKEHITDELREWYFRHIERAQFLQIPPRAAPEIDTIAQTIYAELMAEVNSQSAMDN